ncbi:universal stress protein [Pararhodobacter aggregans]|uniref:Universal stress protein n=1 Tax=Pararhodobacter aggregans TaxID=404875 RepID=A0A2T7USS3_9RHOB|nr:universal stress protein [Pararhodobacter aggregans]PTX03477.1 nucleotide-binding universal stress UspA family protein [Pararhodobacter aggregans]PVE47767.1 universal stress protein [Pararhodobacter aggregans]
MKPPVLAALDLVDEALHDAILTKAAQLARLDDAPLAVATVLPDFGLSMVGTYFPADTAQRALADASVRLHALTDRILPGLPVSHIVTQGAIYHEILEQADRIGAGLIVMGAHRPELADYLLGPNAARVLRHARCSVFVLRDPG